jgi:hypothetical protein
MRVASCQYLWSAFLLLPLIGTTSLAQTITVRVVNEANKGPVRDQAVYVSGVAGTGATEQEERQNLLVQPFKPDLRLITDTAGEVRFELPKPMPPFFYVRVKVSEPRFDCTCLVRASTGDVVQEGLLIGVPQAAGAGSTKGSLQPRPSEILIRLRPTPWYVRILWPLLKG